MIYGVGVNDAPFSISVKGHHIKEYKLWKHMIERCYNPNRLKSHKAYDKTKVHKDLLSFMNFYNFVNSCCGFGNDGWNMDKDILGDGTCYSKDCIVFVPQEVNMFFVQNLKRKYEGSIGIKYDKRSGRYCSSVKQGGKTVNLGTFDKPEDAQQAYCRAKEAYAKVLAEKWKGQIDERVYQRLLTFKVKIN